MGVLDRFEKGVERAVSSAFARAFKSEVKPVELASALRREVDDRAVGEGHRGPVTKELQSAFFTATKGDNPRYADWLTYVDD